MFLIDILEQEAVLLAAVGLLALTVCFWIWQRA